MTDVASSKPSDRYFTIVERLQAGQGRETLQETVAEIAREYGLQHIVYLGFNFPDRHEKLPVTALTYPEAWVNRYIEANFLKYDPVLKAGLASLIPIDWRDLDLRAFRHRQVFGEARDYGISHQGITFPIRGQFGDRALVSITMEDSAAGWQRATRHLMRDFQILSHHIHAVALRSEKVPTRQFRLAPREVEVLHWAARGKTSSEIAQILGIGERTSRFYLELARHKLGAVNVTNAVAKAVCLNIISVSL